MFLNPRSAVNLAPAERAALRDAATGAGIEVIDLRPDVDVAAVIRQRMSDDRRLFIAAGGDGTVNSVVQPLVHTDATLAVIPVGTSNHFAIDLGIALDWRAALEGALHGGLEQVDAARAGARFYVSNVSLAVDPDLVARREEGGRDDRSAIAAGPRSGHLV